MGRRDPLIVVSNRGPVGFRRGPGGALEESRGAGGLVTALRPLVDRNDVTWVASAMGDAEREIAAEGRRTERSVSGSPFSLRLVTQDADVYRLFYGVVANPALWFVQHGLWDLKQDPDADLGPAWRARLRRGQPGARGGRRRGARPRSGCPGLRPRLPPLSRARPSSAQRGRTPGSRTSRTSPG